MDVMDVIDIRLGGCYGRDQCDGCGGCDWCDWFCG